MFAVLFTAETLVYLLPALLGPARSDWIQLPFVANSIVKAAMLGAICWVGGADVRRFSPMVPALIAGLSLWVVAAAIILVGGDTSRVFDIAGLNVSVTQIMWAGIAMEASIAVLFAVLYRAAERARFGLHYLSPASFRSLAALAENVVGADADPTPEEVAANVDRYLAGFRAQRKWVMKLALVGLYVYPLATVRPPFPLMAAEERGDFVRKRFLADVGERRIGRLRRWLIQAMIRVAQQMVYLGYYGDPRSFDSVGYVPFSKRPRFRQAMQRVDRDRPGVTALTPADLDGDGEIEADAVVIGSGAGGAIAAYELAKAERSVLVLERGLHVDPRRFSEDEVEMISRLYSDGALQLSRDFRFQVLQGMCVGGSTVVNNAVCFEIPDRVLDEWTDPGGHDSGLDAARLRQAFGAVRKRLHITEQPATFLNPGASKFTDGVGRLGLDQPPGRFGAVEANIADCFGCGYCNIGCAYGKKLSMLDTVLPEGQRRFGDRLRILSECRAERIRTQHGRAVSIDCRLPGRRRLRVGARTVVVAAGAINSSWLLRRSGLGGPLAGRNLAFNMASPLTADFDEELNSYDGLQISHFFEPPQSGGFVMETWWNPVVSQALNMPGWLDDHTANMRRYPHMTAAGVLVGTDRNARVRRAWTGGPEVDYTPRPEDLSHLIDGLKLLGRIYLAAGARRVMPNTFVFREFSTEAELDRLDRYVRDASDISIGTGHPQGGNAISRDPGKGVVDPSFRLHGMENIFVCDASVFPSSITVNPQMTVMALAEYAAPSIVAG